MMDIKRISILLLLLNSINYVLCYYGDNDNFNNTQPSFVKLALTETPFQVRVTWFTWAYTNTPIVLYSAESMDMLFREYNNPDANVKTLLALYGDIGVNVADNVTVQEFNEHLWSGYSLTTILDDLKPYTTYFYKVGDKEGNVWSSEFNFTTGAFSTTDVTPFSLVAYGDMGAGGDDMITIGHVSGIIDQLSFVLHVGDIAYANLHGESQIYGNQTVWNQFMNQVEHITASTPYITTPGNHDIFMDSSVYRKTWVMPSTPYKDSTWYSFDYNGVHFISISSEHIYTPFSTQHRWIENDLKTYRQNNPDGWIVAYAHRPFYCSSVYRWCHDDPVKTVFVASLEKLLYKYNVDLFIGGHSHSYERTLPVYNNQVMGTYSDPKAPVHIVVGTGGCQESILKAWMDQPNWSSGERLLTAGYGRLNILNSTTLHWEFYGDVLNERLDSVYINKGYF